MKTSWSAEFSIFEDMPIVLVGVVELLVGLVGITGWGKEKKHMSNKLMFSVLLVTTKLTCNFRNLDPFLFWISLFFRLLKFLPN